MLRISSCSEDRYIQLRQRAMDTSPDHKYGDKVRHNSPLLCWLISRVLSDGVGNIHSCFQCCDAWQMLLSTIQHKSFHDDQTWLSRFYHTQILGTRMDVDLEVFLDLRLDILGASKPATEYQKLLNQQLANEICEGRPGKANLSLYRRLCVHPSSQADQSFHFYALWRNCSHYVDNCVNFNPAQRCNHLSIKCSNSCYHHYANCCGKLCYHNTILSTLTLQSNGVSTSTFFTSIPGQLLP